MTRPTLSFDGLGINGPDEYRSRVATFATQEAAQEYGELFAAAPDMKDSLYNAASRFESLAVFLDGDNQKFAMFSARMARDAAAKGEA